MSIGVVGNHTFSSDWSEHSCLNSQHQHQHENHWHFSPSILRVPKNICPFSHSMHTQSVSRSLVRMRILPPLKWKKKMSGFTGTIHFILIMFAFSSCILFLSVAFPTFEYITRIIMNEVRFGKFISNGRTLNWPRPPLLN